MCEVYAAQNRQERLRVFRVWVGGVCRYVCAESYVDARDVAEEEYDAHVTPYSVVEDGVTAREVRSIVGQALYEAKSW